MSISKLEVLKLLRSDLKRSLETAKYPPNYKYDFDFYKHSLSSYHSSFDPVSPYNCYAYAMQFKIEIEDVLAGVIGSYYSPGFLTGTIPTYWTKDSLLFAFFSDCDVLDIDYTKTTIDEKIESDSYKIAIMLESVLLKSKDFHFMRQNDDMTWSHKYGYQYDGIISTLPTPAYNPDYEVIEVVKIKKKSI